MKTLRIISFIILSATVPLTPALAQQDVPLGQNAALRYWSAFAEMQDSAITEQQAKEFHALRPSPSEKWR